jgi:hypothetical protein
MREPIDAKRFPLGEIRKVSDIVKSGSGASTDPAGFACNLPCEKERRK